MVTNINNWSELIQDLHKILKSTLNLLLQKTNHWNIKTSEKHFRKPYCLSLLTAFFIQASQRIELRLKKFCKN